jgi:hypothetical protein
MCKSERAAGAISALVQHYGHLSPGHCTQAIERIAGEFHNAVHNSPFPSMWFTLQNDG